MTTLFTMMAAFLVGGIPFGVLLARRAGVDVRSKGSRNIGAANVARTAGRSLGISTLVLDALKGASAVWMGMVLGDVRLGAGAGCASVLGHVFSPYLGFRGGKGVSTAAGVFLALSPWSAVAAIFTFVVVFGLLRIVSIGSVAAALVLPTVAVLVGAQIEVVGLAGATAILVVVRHIPNLKRWLRGEEPRWAPPQTKKDRISIVS